MKKLLYIFLFVFLISACAQEKNFKSVSTKEFISQLESDSTLVVLDVRTEPELSGPLGHINGVINIPVQALASRINELEQYKNNTIAVICRSGNRSQAGTRILTENGFDAYNVEGGMRQYRKETED